MHREELLMWIKQRISAYDYEILEQWVNPWTPEQQFFVRQTADGKNIKIDIMATITIPFKESEEATT